MEISLWILRTIKALVHWMRLRLPKHLAPSLGKQVQRVPGSVPVPITPGTQGLDGEALSGAARVSLQLLSQTLTNYSPFPSGEEHPVLQILTRSAPGKPREVWLLQQLQGGSEDLPKGPVSFALALTPAVHPYHASTSRNPEGVPLKICCNQCTLHGPARETSMVVPSSSHDHTAHPRLAALLLDALEAPKRDGTSQAWL